MNYFDPYPCLPDQTTISAWDTQVAEIARTPRLAEVLEKCGTDLFPRFAACYAEMRALPRSARRGLQRRIARSSELAALLPEYLQQGGRRLQHRMAWSVAGAALLLALGQGIAAAATINVTTKNPHINSDGQCSLIEAIVNANDDAMTHADCLAGSGADTIALPTGTHTLKEINNNSYGANGLPVITSTITIQGNGAKIRRQANAPAFRLMAVSNSGDLTLQDVTLSGGHGFYYDFGGAIYNSGGTVTIENSTISGNKADYGGGGVCNSGGTVTVKSSTISRNRANVGGGISNGYGGSLAIDASTVSKNGADFGGGVFNSATVTITNTSITGNKAIGFFAQGGGLLNNSDAIIQNSTLSKNAASVGGGAFNRGLLTIQNSTVSGNMASETGGGAVNFTAYGYAGLTITNSTISGNKARYGGGLHNSSFSYYYDVHSKVTLRRSLISGNNANYAPQIENFDVLTADNFNLFGADGNAGVYNFTPGLTDIVPADGISVGKILGLLKNNGGLTKTHALVAGSPALDAVPLLDPGCVGTDQRGVNRPQGTGCDIGAFERDGP